MIGLVALVELSSFAAITVATRNNVMARTRQELNAGGRVFTRLMDARTRQLLDNVEILASDFGFKQAVATGDRGTIRSVLLNHGTRIDADLAMLVSTRGDVTASTLETAAHERAFPFPQLFARAQSKGSATGVVAYKGHAYQLVIVPVYAPLPIAWVCMGFAVDAQLAADLKSLTLLNVSFLSADRAEQADRPVTTLPPAASRSLTADFSRIKDRTQATAFTSDLAGERYLSLAVPLANGADGTVIAVLQTSIEEALEPYARLRSQLAVIALTAFLAALLLAFFIVRGIVRPLRALAQTAERIGAGDYRKQVSIASRDELGQLARAFHRMQAGIAEREARIAHQAYHDGLTGLPNRSAMQAQLGKAIARARRAAGALALLMLDINRFKEINDSLGHETGDRVLKELAARLTGLMRQGDTVARLGSDEFLLMLEGSAEEDALAVARRIADALQRSIALPDMQINLVPSIGIALFPAHGDDPETLMRRADIAMHEARQAHLPWQLYQPGRDERHLHRLSLVSDLRRAIAADELTLHYQPKASLADGRADNLEALVRWRHPRLGLVPPDEFIPLAEQSGHIHALTEWVLRNVIAQCRAWSAQGLLPAVSVNLSALDLVNPHLPERLSAWLQAADMDAGRLVLEITESAIMRDAEYAMQTLARLRDCGVRLSIDDFGTGYSSLAQLKRLPVNELKIDKSFLIDFRPDGEDAVIVRSTIDLAHNMGLKVVAEGVQSEACLRFLRVHRCDLAQGYFISPPMPAALYPQWFEDYRCRRAS